MTHHTAKLNFVNWYFLMTYNAEIDHAFIPVREKSYVPLSGYRNSKNNRQGSAHIWEVMV
jgi:hypothetical protein